MTPSCPICGNRRSAEVFRAEDQPAMLNRLYATRSEARAAPAVEALAVDVSRASGLRVEVSDVSHGNGAAP